MPLSFQQSGAGGFDLADDGVQRIFRYLRIVVQPVQGLLLAFEFLQQVGFKVGAAGDLEYLEQDAKCGMVIRAVSAFDEAAEAKEEILQSQHGAHSLVERELVTDHFRLVRWDFIGCERYRQHRMTSIAFRSQSGQTLMHVKDSLFQVFQTAIVIDDFVR